MSLLMWLFPQFISLESFGIPLTSVGEISSGPHLPISCYCLLLFYVNLLELHAGLRPDRVAWKTH